MKDVWSDITIASEAVRSQLDLQTVKNLELLAPAHCLNDRRRINELMDNGALFSSVTDQLLRDEIRERILAVKSRIPSLSTFFEDSMFLSLCSRIMRSLFPSTWQHSDQLEEKWRQIYKGEHFRRDYRELWTFVFRHSFEILGKSPRRDAPSLQLELDKEQCVTVKHFAFEARRLQFVSPEIHRLTIGAQIERSLYQAERVEPAELSNHSVNLPRKYRCGAPHTSDYTRDRKFLFLSNIDRDYPDEPRSYVSTFGIKRDIFIAFLGINSDAYDNLALKGMTEHDIASQEIDTNGNKSPAPERVTLGKRVFDEIDK